MGAPPGRASPVPMLHTRVVRAYIKNPWYSTSSVNFLTLVLSYPQKTRPKRDKEERNRFWFFFNIYVYLFIYFDLFLNMFSIFLNKTGISS